MFTPIKDRRNEQMQKKHFIKFHKLTKTMAQIEKVRLLKKIYLNANIDKKEIRNNWFAKSRKCKN